MWSCAPRQPYQNAHIKNGNSSDDGCYHFLYGHFYIEDGIKTTPCSQCALNALAIDEPLEYAKLYLDGTMQIWVDIKDSIEL